MNVPFAFPHTHLPMIQHRKVVTPGAVPCKGRFLSCSITQASTSSDWLYPIAVANLLLCTQQSELAVLGDFFKDIYSILGNVTAYV